jgi:predicted ABC-type transport system involved in lysophospholipase L1 biosynthesis ATPase subunit
MDHFEEIVAGGKTAIVVVTHDPDIAARCLRTFPMEDGVLRNP